ncbi:MAG: chloride channel protein [Caldilineales bacterium]
MGYLIFTLLNVPPFASFLYEGELVALNLSVVLWAIALGLAGGLLAIYAGIAMQAADRVMSVFGDRIIARALAAGAIIGIVCFFVPNLMFSGEGTIQAIIADAAQIGIPMLLLMALVKPLLLSLSFKGGYLGGPIFPSLFAAIMLGAGPSA